MKIGRYAFLCAAFVFAAVDSAECRLSFEEPAPGREDGRVYYYVPDGIDLSAPSPLLVFLHGGDSSSPDDAPGMYFSPEKQRLMPDIASAPFIVVAPSAPHAPDGSRWNRDGVSRLIDATIAAAERKFKIDRDRIFLGGLDGVRVGSRSKMGKLQNAAQPLTLRALYGRIQGMERREFIESISCLGGFFAFAGASAGCRTVCDGDSSKAAQKTFENRFPHERLSLSYRHVKIGLEKPFSILHISDTHLCEAYPDELPYDTRWARYRNSVFGGKQEEALRDSLSWAKANVDAVLHTGDLIDFQTRANFDLAKKYFGMAPDMFGCMGNHEFQRHREGEPIRNTAEYNSLSAGELRKVYPFDLSLQSTVLGGVNFVAIEQVYGFVTAGQVERFHAEAKKGLPIVLCMHAPLVTEEIWRANCKFWPGCGTKYREETVKAASGDFKRQIEDKTTSDFIAYLKREPLLKAVLAGHLHIAVQDRFSPTAMEYVTGPNFLFNGQEIMFS